MSFPRILAVESDAEVLAHLRELCIQWNLSLEVAEDGAGAMELLERKEFGLVVSAAELRDLSGLELLKKVKRRQAEMPVVLVADNPDIAQAVRAMKSGASDYLDKPLSRETLELSLTGLLEGLCARDGNGKTSCCVPEETAASAEGNTGEGHRQWKGNRLLTGNRMMKRAIGHALSLADVRAPVLLEGETGVGKALLAEEIHRHSRRRGPFVQVTCTALAEYLLASEMFGHVRGAFSGANRDRQGKLEAANGGVLFVDGIAEASLALQRRMLRVLEDGVVERVGEGRPVRVDLKVVVATNRDLAELVWEGRFCEPLYHRLCVARVKIPALRHRKDDISLLARTFLSEFRERNGRGPRELSDGCVKALEEYGWPGNVEELESVVHTGASMCPEGVAVMGQDHLPGVLSREPLRIKHAPMEGIGHNTALSYLLQQRERTFVEQALAATDYNIQHSAKLLRISRPTLYAKMKLFGLTRED